MAATGYTPIQLYYSTTASQVPLAANMANGELAINITDGKIYYKNNSGVVTLFGSSSDVTTISFGTTGLTPSTATGGAVTVAGTLVAANGGTGQSSYTTGDLIYASGSTALSKLAIGTNGYVLTSSGSAPQWTALSSIGVTTFSAGTTGLTPSSATAGAITLAGTLNVANGGTGLTSLTAGYIPFGAGTSAFGSSANLFWDSVNSRLGVGTASPTSQLTTQSNITSQSGAYLIGLYYSSGWKYAVTGGGLGAVSATDGNGWYFSTAPASGTLGAAATVTERMRLDSSGNLGLGVTPSAWVGQTALQVGSAALSSGNSRYATVSNNLYATSAGFSAKYINTGFGTLYLQDYADGSHAWYRAPSGTAGTVATITQAMTLDASGQLGLGTTTPDIFGRGYTRMLTVSSSGSSAVQINAATGNTAWVDFGVNASRVGSIAVSSSIFELGTNGAVPIGLFTNANYRLYITSGGDVGIGTTSPSGRLHVLGSGGTRTITADTTGYAASLSRSTGGDFYVGINDSAGTAFGSTAYSRAIWGDSAYPMVFGTNSTERMRIDSSGNLLFNGTTVKNNAPGVSVKTSQQGFIVYNGVDASYNELGVWDGSADGLKAVIKAESGVAKFGSRTNSSMALQTNDTVRVTVDSTGNTLFAQAVRATISTPNTLSFDMNTASNFKSTISAGGALTFTNITSGQTGNIILVNGSNYAITAAATTKVSSTCLATISATGTYWLSYYSDGTNVYVANTGALA